MTPSDERSLTTTLRDDEGCVTNALAGKRRALPSHHQRVGAGQQPEAEQGASAASIAINRRPVKPPNASAAPSTPTPASSECPHAIATESITDTPCTIQTVRVTSAIQRTKPPGRKRRKGAKDQGGRGGAHDDATKQNGDMTGNARQPGGCGPLGGPSAADGRGAGRERTGARPKQVRADQELACSWRAATGDQRCTPRRPVWSCSCAARWGRATRTATRR